jgi:hypothetical protein
MSYNQAKMKHTIKNSAKNKRLKILASGSALVAFVLIAAIVYLVVKTNSLTSDLTSSKAQLTQQSQAQNQKLLNEIDNQASLLRPTVLVKDQLVAFPELGLALPYDKVSKTLQYTVDDNGDARVTSTLLVDHKDRQLSCSQLVRVSTVKSEVYSPWEEAAGTLKLPDGKMVYIVAAKSFKNNQASTQECATEVWTQITPQKVADEFKMAKSL